MAKRKRRKFTDQFKADAVKLCEAGGRTIRQVAVDLDLTETALREWIKRAATDAGKGPPNALTTAERDELGELRKRVKRLEMEREILKKSGGLLREGERVKFAFIDEEKATWPIEALCEVLGVSRSGFYAWRGRPPSPREAEDAQLVDDIKAAHEAGRGAYGSPRVHRVLRKQGKRIGKKRVERLMRREGIVAKKRKKFCITTDSRHTDPIAPNILQRNFAVAVPNAAWVTDVTYVPTREGWLYLAVILDLCSRRAVGWATSGNNDRQLALDALARATSAREPSSGLIHHSDRGSVYASGDYRDALDDMGAVPSMSRKGDCWDNAVAESFFATIKGEMIDDKDFETRAEATAAIADYIDAFYNVKRMHSTIGYVSPIEFELKLQSGREAA